MAGAKKKRIAWADVAIGAAVSLLVMLAFFMKWGDGLELKLYDMRAKMQAQKNAGRDVILIGIDDQSIRELGRWPWPRNYIAGMIDQLSDAQAKVIGLDILFSNPELNPGLEEIQNLKKLFADRPDAAEFEKALEDSEKRLDNDTRLSDSLQLAQNTAVVLPMYFTLGEASVNNPKPIPPEVDKNFIANIKSNGTVTPARDFVPPYPLFAKDAKAIGHINLVPSADGVQRFFPLVVDYNGRLFPAFGLQVLRAYNNLESDDYRFNPGRDLVLGRAHIPVDDQGRMLITYYNREQIPHFYFSDVVNHKVPMEVFRDKIVLIGMMATAGGEDQYSTPITSGFPGVEIHADVIQSIIDGNYLVRPEWATKAEVLALLLFALFVSAAIPHLSAGKSALIAAGLLGITVGGGFWLFMAHGYWIKLLYPCLMLAAGYTVVVSKRYLVTEKRTEALEGESAETNKMLGLSFQGQGMLDMAFEKFRRCPVDDSMKDVLYNLGLDFERKRQFNKAVSVFEQIATVDRKFKDIEERMQRLRVAGETIMLGGGLGRAAGSDSTVLVQGGAGNMARPTLGRYEVLKELGKGAMGVVYLGRDPKINREVAIKTLRFADEFDPENVKAMRERFFREAESAGKLVHPNIVTIYDAGEDGEISYIAMELLDGIDFKEYTQKWNLLPVREVLEAMAKVADALDYAAMQGVVHRDIKPANIMRLKSGEIKVTDFGIARITSESKTATGAVLGTPSYMAPEQLAGKRVDGRADLFSLGVTTYELLCGVRPFTAESLATLMYRIANEPHAPLSTQRIDLAPELNIIVDKALQKDPEKRFGRGAEFAGAIREFLKNQVVAANA